MIQDRESLLSEILLEWEEYRQNGEGISAAQLCVDHPELIDEVDHRIRALELVYRIPNRGVTDVRADDELQQLPQVPGFEILDTLGHGGMGVVYKARHERLNRICALKMVRYQGPASPIERLRFRIEAEAIAALQHPHIVQLFEVGDVEGRPYLVLEYLEGSTLADRIRTTSITTHEAVATTIALAQAVDYAHRRGIVHRDLKPGNVLLTVDDVAKVTDFGLAKRLAVDTNASTDARATATGAVFGTPSYMAPEQALGRNDQIGPATDIYAIGAILYEMLTGRPPFLGASTLETLDQVRDWQPTAPSRLRSGVPRDLESICLKCLDKETARRYETAGAIAEDLQRFLRGEPTVARPVTAWERAWKAARRRPAIAALLSTVLVLLSLMAVGGTTLAIMASRAARAARDAAAAEKVSKELAEARVAETSAVLKFVENHILAAARPEGQMGGLGRDVSLRNAVEAALQFVDTGFANEPLIEARLRLTLGLSFYYLGDGPRAAEQNEKAYALYRQHFGPDHADTLRSAKNLAISYDMLGQYAEALKLREDTLARQRVTSGSDHPDTVAAMNNLAISFENLGRDQEALELREQILDLDTANFGPDHPDTLRSMSNLANSYADMRRFEDAFAVHEKALARRRAVLGPDHPDTLLTMGNLAMDHCELGRPADALAVQQALLALQQQKLGVDHPHTLITMNNVGVSLASLGRHDEALELRQQVLALHEAKFGREHAATLRAQYILAKCLAELGRHEEALALHQKTLELRKSVLGPEHPDTMWSMYDIAECLVDLDRGPDALAVIDDCLQAGAKQVEDPHLMLSLLDLRLRHFENNGDAVGCQTTAEMWESLNRTDADSLYTAATFRAAVAAVFQGDSSTDAQARADDQADRAMNWLRRAIAAGYGDPASIAGDETLASLRNREDFQELVEKLADSS